MIFPKAGAGDRLSKRLYTKKIMVAASRDGNKESEDRPQRENSFSLCIFYIN